MTQKKQSFKMKSKQMDRSRKYALQLINQEQSIALNLNYASKKICRFDSSFV
jgi:hemerythrin